MKISQIQEEKVVERKLYLGVENFYPVAVNPTKQELIDMGIPAQEEPQYVTKVKRDFGQGEQEYDQVSIRIFLDNNDPDDRIRTQVSYNIVRTDHLSSTNKYKVLNKYGTSTWLEKEYIGAGSLPSNMQWYLNEDVKKALRNEDLLIDFVKALYNLPYVNQSSPEDVKKKAVVMFTDADFDKLFRGDFSDLRKLIAVDASKQKVGYLMGVRNVEGTYKQTVFNKEPLKPYVRATNKTEYLVSNVRDAQANGAFSDVIFDLGDTKLKQFDESIHVAQADGSIGSDIDEDDDLPF